MTDNILKMINKGLYLSNSEIAKILLNQVKYIRLKRMVIESNIIENNIL